MTTLNPKIGCVPLSPPLVPRSKHREQPRASELLDQSSYRHAYKILISPGTMVDIPWYPPRLFPNTLNKASVHPLGLDTARQQSAVPIHRKSNIRTNLKIYYKIKIIVRIIKGIILITWMRSQLQQRGVPSLSCLGQYFWFQNG